MRLEELLEEIDSARDKGALLRNYAIKYTTLGELKADRALLSEQIVALYHRNFII